MQFLKSETADPTPLIRNLEKVDAHLRETDNTFMVTDHLTRADCYVLPTLQHIRVAGKVCHLFIAFFIEMSASRPIKGQGLLMQIHINFFYLHEQ